MRILADLSEDDIQWLDRKATEQGKSRAALLREAIAAYRAGAPDDWLGRGFGLWRGKAEVGDAVEWQRRERASWTRPWDDDYEQVRAEFPDLFGEQDDRERARYLALVAGGKDERGPDGA